MSTRCQLFYTLAMLTAALFFGAALGRLETGDDTVKNLYHSLLQREYAGPVVFPSHRVERKAQRSSPSLRLRFGRSIPDTLLPSAEKRWFGDVNKKPIRSPSLRLRFGRRSDPSMPIRSSFDELMDSDPIADGSQGTALNGYGQLYGDDFDESPFKRMLRKAQLRLRFGRSMPNGVESQFSNFLEDEAEKQQLDEYVSDFLIAEKLGKLLALRNYEDARDDETDEFQREVRKPAPLRLRFGRNAVDRTVDVAENGEQKNTLDTSNDKNKA